MRHIKVTITFTNGTVKVIEYAGRAKVYDGVLVVSNDRPFSGGTEHLGSFPLVNIREWKAEEH